MMRPVATEPTLQGPSRWRGLVTGIVLPLVSMGLFQVAFNQTHPGYFAKVAHLSMRALQVTGLMLSATALVGAMLGVGLALLNGRSRRSATLRRL